MQRGRKPAAIEGDDSKQDAPHILQPTTTDLNKPDPSGSGRSPYRFNNSAKVIPII